MAKTTVNYTRLGLFVMAGIAFLILLLYIIGKNQNMFGKSFELKARFGNVQGLVQGDNIRFAGINAGSVKSVEVLNDTTIEVTMLVKTGMQPFIRRNARITIATDGLIGNRVVNIESGRTPAPVVQEGDVLFGADGPTTDQMLSVLNNTTNDVSAIAAELKKTVVRINESKAVWRLLNDESLPADLKHSLGKVRLASDKMAGTMTGVYDLVQDVKNGRGTAGQLLTDTTIASKVAQSLEGISRIGKLADSLSARMIALVTTINDDLNSGDGTVHVLMKDKQTAARLQNTIRNIEQDTEAFNEVMDALKQSFLLRGYFRKMEKQKKTQDDKQTMSRPPQH